MERGRIITYERLIDAIYNEMYNENFKDNVIENEEMRALYYSFYNAYIAPLFEKDSEEYFKRCDEFNAVVFGFCRKGFEVGFKAAMVLRQPEANAAQN